MNHCEDNPLKSNRRHLWRIYIVVIGFSISALAMALSAPGSSGAIFLASLFCGAVLVVVLRWWLRRRVLRNMARLLRQPDPDVVLAYYDRTIRTGGLTGALAPDMELIKVYSKAFVLAMYGEHERSRALVSGYDLSNRPPMIQATGLLSEVVNDMLQRRNLNEALRNAQECVRLSRVPAVTPGARLATEAHATWVDIGEVLCGNREAALFARMEGRFAKGSAMLRPPVAWGLCLAYKEQDPARHDELMRWLRDHVPYCTPLLQT